MLKCFFYLLLRDELTAGIVEKIVRECEKTRDLTILYSNDFVAGYAQELVDRLVPNSYLGDGEKLICPLSARDVS
jgi:hypothetical protein